MDRHGDTARLYAILESLEATLGGRRSLAECNGHMVWPARGVYFFFEPGETRLNSGLGPRVVRVGTHALKLGSGTSLWQRLSQHRGISATGGGNHRGSVFRRLVGNAIKNRDHLAEPRSWDVANDPATAASLLGLTREQVLIAEQPLEAAVSDYIRRMSVLWLAIDDSAGPRSDRGTIERNTIALLSGYRRAATDPSSKQWLGSHCDRERVRQSGLWNNHYTDQEYEPTQLAVIERYVQRMQCTGA